MHVFFFTRRATFFRGKKKNKLEREPSSRRPLSSSIHSTRCLRVLNSVLSLSLSLFLSSSDTTPCSRPRSRPALPRRRAAAQCASASRRPLRRLGLSLRRPAAASPRWPPKVRLSCPEFFIPIRQSRRGARSLSASRATETGEQSTSLAWNRGAIALLFFFC